MTKLDHVFSLVYLNGLYITIRFFVLFYSYYTNQLLICYSIQPFLFMQSKKCYFNHKTFIEKDGITVIMNYEDTTKLLTSTVYNIT